MGFLSKVAILHSSVRKEQRARVQEEANIRKRELAKSMQPILVEQQIDEIERRQIAENILRERGIERPVDERPQSYMACRPSVLDMIGATVQGGEEALVDHEYDANSATQALGGSLISMTNQLIKDTYTIQKCMDNQDSSFGERQKAYDLNLFEEMKHKSYERLVNQVMPIVPTSRQVSCPAPKPTSGFTAQTDGKTIRIGFRTTF